MTSTISSPPKSIAIIGASLGGLTLALSLKKRGVDSKVYELRDPNYDFGGAIMLSPNALRVLDSVGAYDRVRNLGFNFDTLSFTTDHDHKTPGVYYFGNKETYGYAGLRIYRKVLIAELRKMVEEQGIPIIYEKKFSQVVSEDEKSVRFAFADGTEEEAEILVGVDGIHSKVRNYLYPDIVPQYSGFMGVSFAMRASKLRLPEGHSEYPLPVTIMGKHGAFLLAPQNADGGELFAGRQFRYPMKDREGWDILLKEKTELITMVQSSKSDWSDLVQSAMEQLSGSDYHSLNIWPFHTVPKLEKWYSKTGRVIIIGDAAHAIPPTAGQGANQAFEDSQSLAFLLTSLSSEVDYIKALEVWQQYRQGRVDKVILLSSQMNNLRLSEEEKKNLPQAQVWSDNSSEMGKGNELAWLYLSNVEEHMETELAKVKK